MAKMEISIEMTQIPRIISLIASFCSVLLKSSCLNNLRSCSRSTCDSIQLSFSAVGLCVEVDVVDDDCFGIDDLDEDDDVFEVDDDDLDADDDDLEVDDDDFDVDEDDLDDVDDGFDDDDDSFNLLCAEDFFVVASLIFNKQMLYKLFKCLQTARVRQIQIP